MAQPIGDATVAVLRAAVGDPRVRARYGALVYTVPLDAASSGSAGAGGCWVWLGALSGRGHGRFWLGRGADGRHVVMVAHRFGFAVQHGVEALLATDTVMHLCDEACCQNPGHWAAGTAAVNAGDWGRRRRVPGSPLRDLRGAAGRARALRDAALNGGDLVAAAEVGVPDIDRWQATLF